MSSNLHIGRKTQISSFVKIKSGHGSLRIGEAVSIGTGCFISSDTGGVEIGDFTLIGPNCAIVGNNYNYAELHTLFVDQGTSSKGIRIGQNVFIGTGAVILDGAEIGDGVMITPNSVVSGKIASYVIVQGNPAKVVFKRR